MVELRAALRLPAVPRLALVGSGGKSTALFALARQLAGPVLATTTTHLAIEQLVLADRHLEISRPEDIALLGEVPSPGVTLLTGPPTGEGRVAGLDSASLEQVRSLADHWQVPILIEADGARLRPLKAPASHEPAIPAFVDQVVITAGLSGLEKPLSGEWVHRPEIFAALAGISLGERLTVEALARVLLHPKGGLKNIPPSARRTALLTQADSPLLQPKAQSLAQHLLPAVAAVVVTTQPTSGRAGTDDSFPNKIGTHAAMQVLAVFERVAGIVLAAGASTRMGTSKQLLEWNGQPFVRSIARTALTAGLSPVVVVTGDQAAAVEAAVQGLDLLIVFNPDWKGGQSTSVRIGMRAIQGEVGGAVFLLADQPHLPPSLLQALVEQHARTLSPVVAPLVAGRRANPVLFDRVTFPALERLQGDQGGRAVFSQFQIEWLNWQDESILLDVDSPEDYQKLLGHYRSRDA
jgi:molybdenum cofactor cytidylyltransferase